MWNDDAIGLFRFFLQFLLAANHIANAMLAWMATLLLIVW